jgi:hypothetical protein
MKMAGNGFKIDKIPEEHDDRSSTEVDESLLGEDERQWSLEQMHQHRLNKRRASRLSRVCTTLNSCRWIVDWTLLLVILGFVIRGQMREPQLNPYDFGGDLTGVAPRCKLPFAALTIFNFSR